MERLPLKARIGPSFRSERNSPNNKSPTRSMSHYEDYEEGERGEINEGDRSRSIDFRGRERSEHRDRERDRDYERPPYDDARYTEPPRRDDVYVPSRAPHPTPYVRDTRDWRDRDVRNDREWTRDRGRGRHFRGGRGSWRDDRGRGRDFDRERERERYQERYRDREPRGSYDRPRERGWERDDGIRDRNARYPGESYYGSSHPSSRRPEPDYRHRSPPPPSRARPRSPPPYLQRDASRSRSPRSPVAPRPPMRLSRVRSPSRSREEGSSRGYRRRSSSTSSRRSTPPRRDADKPPPTYPTFAFKKRDRSNSPVGSDTRASRRVRTASKSPASERQRTPSPLPSQANHRVLNRPVTEKEPPTKPTHYEKQFSVAKAPDPINWNLVPKFPRSHAESFNPTKKSPALDTNTPTISSPSPSSTPPVPSPIVAREEPEDSDASTFGMRALNARRSGRVPPPSILTEQTRAQAEPRSAVAQTSPASQLKIPWLELPNEDKELETYAIKREKWYENYLSAKVALRRAAAEAEVVSFEYRSAEMRRIYAEQQKQRALES